MAFVTQLSPDKSNYFLSFAPKTFYNNISRETMDLIINKGIVKKSADGELHPFVLKDFKSGFEFPLTQTSMSFHELREGDLVEFAGRVQDDCVYLAIAGVDYRVNMN